MRCLPSSTLDGNKRHSAYRSCPVIIEYRWHPLYGKKVLLFRRTGRRGSQVVHLELNRKYSRELPAWMVDAAVCGAMSVGTPQLSAKALSELRAVVSALSSADGSLKPSPTEGPSHEASKPIVETSTPAVTRTRAAARADARSASGATCGAGRSAARSAGRSPSRIVNRAGRTS